jgi:hypothetical protein
VYCILDTGSKKKSSIEAPAYGSVLKNTKKLPHILKAVHQGSGDTKAVTELYCANTKVDLT